MNKWFLTPPELIIALIALILVFAPNVTSADDQLRFGSFAVDGKWRMRIGILLTFAIALEICIRRSGG